MKHIYVKFSRVGDLLHSPYYIQGKMSTLVAPTHSIQYVDDSRSVLTLGPDRDLGLVDW